MENYTETKKQIINDLFDDNAKLPSQTINSPPQKSTNDNNHKVDSSFNIFNNKNENQDSDSESTPKQNQKQAFDFNKLNIQNKIKNENELLNSNQHSTKYNNLRETDLFSGFCNQNKPIDNKTEKNITNLNNMNLQFDKINECNKNIPNVGLLNQNINFDTLFDNINFKDDVKNDEIKIKEIEANRIKNLEKERLNNNNKNKQRQINNNKAKVQLLKEEDFFDDNSNDYGNHSNNNFQLVNNKAIHLETICKYNQANGSIKTKSPANFLSFKKGLFLNKIFFNSFITESINFEQVPEYQQIDSEALSFQITADLEDILINNNQLVDTITSQLTFDYCSLISSPIGPCIVWNDMNSLFISDTHSFREVLCDGDGFFRAFMFSYGEHLINEGNIFKLKQIAYIISIKINKSFVYRDIQIDKNEILIIFSFIFNAFESNNKKQANDYWIKGFIGNTNFSLGMIKYAKIMLGNYLEEHSDKLNTEELINNHIINPHYILNNKLNLKDYLIEKVFRMNNDDEPLLIYLIPIVFNISLSIYSKETIEKYYLFSSLKQANKHHFPITLMFHEYQYYVVNTKNYFNTNSSYISFLNQNQKNKSRMSLFCENTKCDICSSYSDEVIFEQMPSNSFCKHCLIESLNKIVSTRISDLINEEYSHIQCNYYIYLVNC